MGSVFISTEMVHMISNVCCNLKCDWLICCWIISCIGCRYLILIENCTTQSGSTGEDQKPGTPDSVNK